MTGYLSSANSISNLFNMVQNCSGSQAFNLVHVSTAYKVLADLTTRQQPRQEHEALQTAGEPREQLLSLLDQLTASQITARTPAAAETAPGSSSSQDSPQRGRSRAAIGQPAAGRYVRSLSGIVHSCARIRHKLSWDTLLLLLDAFLLAAEEQQQQQQQQLQQMDQRSAQATRESSQRSRSNSGGDGSSSSSADGSHQQLQAMCHALSLLCWGLSKAGFTCTSVYELSSSEQEQEQQLRLEQQQQYWQRLAAAGVHLVQYGSTRDISTLCYACATGGYKVSRLTSACLITSPRSPSPLNPAPPRPAHATPHRAMAHPCHNAYMHGSRGAYDCSDTPLSSDRVAGAAEDDQRGVKQLEPQFKHSEHLPTP